jgi:catechol 2,3-dioxygenase-like lactoylglutathione lyase family enzyme
MLSHVNLGVSDFERAFAFYSAVLPILGWKPRFRGDERGLAGWQPNEQDRPLLLVGRPFDGNPAHPGNGQMVALNAPSREAVREFHAAALAAGGACEGRPGLRPDYHPHFYGAYVRDTEGNKLCACCHDPEG